MYSLLCAHCKNQRIELTDFLRAAYQAKYQKELPPNSLMEDVRQFIATQNTPPYAVDFLIGIYGAH